MVGLWKCKWVSAEMGSCIFHSTPTPTPELIRLRLPTPILTLEPVRLSFRLQLQKLKKNTSLFDSDFRHWLRSLNLLDLDSDSQPVKIRLRFPAQNPVFEHFWLRLPLQKRKNTVPCDSWKRLRPMNLFDPKLRLQNWKKWNHFRPRVLTLQHHSFIQMFLGWPCNQLKGSKDYCLHCSVWYEINFA